MKSIQWLPLTCDQTDNYPRVVQHLIHIAVGTTLLLVSQDPTCILQHVLYMYTLGTSLDFERQYRERGVQSRILRFYCSPREMRAKVSLNFA